MNRTEVISEEKQWPRIFMIERYEVTGSISSTILQKDKYKEKHIQEHHSKTAENQRKGEKLQNSHIFADGSMKVQSLWKCGSKHIPSLWYTNNFTTYTKTYTK